MRSSEGGSAGLDARRPLASGKIRTRRGSEVASWAGHDPFRWQAGARTIYARARDATRGRAACASAEGAERPKRHSLPAEIEEEETVAAGPADAASGAFRSSRMKAG